MAVPVTVRVDGVTYDHDLIIDRGKIRKRKKAASRKFRAVDGHTRCRSRRTSRGDAAGSWHRCDGALPVMQQVHQEARRREVDLVVPPTVRDAWRSVADC